MDKEKLVEKIKKLLELSGSPNEAEAKLAYGKAQELMAKYCISLRDAQESPEEIIRLPYNPTVKTTALASHLPFIALAIGQPFGVYVLLKGKENSILLVGFRVNCEVVSHAIDSVLNQCYIDFRKAFAKYRTMTFSENFWSGVRTSMENRFHQPGGAGSGLVVYDPVKNFMNQFTSAATINSSDVTGAAGLAAGTAAGNSAQIRAGVNQPAMGGKLLR